jgi:hypothetical protein
MEFNGFDQSGELAEKVIQLLRRKSMHEPMFRPLKDIFILQEKRRGRQKDEPLLGNQTQDGVSSA